MNYLQQSVEAICSIDTDQLGDLQLGEPTGFGSSFTTNSIGSLSVSGEVTYLGLKLPKILRGHIDLRVLNDVALTHMLVDRVPLLKPMVPKFLGVLAIEGIGSSAVITEDVSKGGEYELGWEVPLPENIEQELFTAFDWAGSPDQVFDFNSLRKVVAFNVNGQPRLLDFTPPLFQPQFRKWPEYRTALHAVDDHLEELTITVGRNSLLAGSIKDLGGKQFAHL